MLYNVIVVSLFDYGDVIYGKCSDSALKRLHMLQKGWERMLLDCDYHDYRKQIVLIIDILSELKWLNIKDWMTFHKISLVYKCRNGLVPQYYAETFSNVSNVSDKHEHHARTKTRQSPNLDKPKKQSTWMILIL